MASAVVVAASLLVEKVQTLVTLLMAEENAAYTKTRSRNRLVQWCNALQNYLCRLLLLMM